MRHEKFTVDAARQVIAPSASSQAETPQRTNMSNVFGAPLGAPRDRLRWRVAHKPVDPLRICSGATPLIIGLPEVRGIKVME